MLDICPMGMGGMHCHLCSKNQYSDEAPIRDLRSNNTFFCPTSLSDPESHSKKSSMPKQRPHRIPYMAWLWHLEPRGAWFWANCSLWSVWMREIKFWSKKKYYPRSNLEGKLDWTSHYCCSDGNAPLKYLASGSVMCI